MVAHTESQCLPLTCRMGLVPCSYNKHLSAIISVADGGCAWHGTWCEMWHYVVAAIAFASPPPPPPEKKKEGEKTETKIIIAPAPNKVPQGRTSSP